MDPDTTNTTEPRMRWAICLGPTGNLQESYKFMSLSTGNKIKRRKFTEMPITESVIRQVSKWASKDRGMSGLRFMDKYGIEYKFDEEEDTIMEEQHIEEAPFPAILAEAPVILTQYENLINGDDVIEEELVSDDQERAMLAVENSGLEFNPMVGPRRGEVIELLDDDDDDAIDDNVNKDMITRVKEEEQEQQKVTENANEDTEMEGTSEQSRRSGREQATPRRYEDYELYVAVEEENEFMLAICKDESIEEEDDSGALEAVGHYIMMHCDEQEKRKKRKKKYKPKAGQFGLDAGLRKFGDRRESVVTKKLHQFNSYNVFKTLYADVLSMNEKGQVLASLIFLKQKQNGDVKARSCANGSLQRDHIAKDEAALPTVTLESVLVTSAIDAHEKKEVVMINIPGAFLHVENKDCVIMRLNGTLAELMAKTKPKLYQKYLSIKKGKKVLYLRLRKAL
jgi:hypothetical protein